MTTATIADLTLLIGGARSGKSALAERLAAATDRPVTFIATMEPRDDEVKRRIAQHQASRPRNWRTVEEPLDLVSAITSTTDSADTVILDCVTLWVSNMLLREFPVPDDIPIRDAAGAVVRCAASARALADAFAARKGETIVVTNEVGMGVIPPHALGRVFTDALGRVNAELATRAGRVHHVVAGLTIELKALGALPIQALGQSPLLDDPRS